MILIRRYFYDTKRIVFILLSLMFVFSYSFTEGTESEFIFVEKTTAEADSEFLLLGKTPGQKKEASVSFPPNKNNPFLVIGPSVVKSADVTSLTVKHRFPVKPSENEFVVKKKEKPVYSRDNTNISD